MAGRGPQRLSIRRVATVTVFGFLLALSAFIPTLALHEVGHGVAAAALGCPARFELNPAALGIRGDIDEACLVRGAGWATAAVGVAGCAVNLGLVALSWPLGALARRWRAAALWLMATAAANYLELFSYLVANTAVPRTDMIPVLAYTRAPHLAVAAVAAIAAVALGVPLFRALDRTAAQVAPRALTRSLIAFFVLLAATLMVVGRLRTVG